MFFGIFGAVFRFFGGKMIFYDSHFHIVQLAQKEENLKVYNGCSCAHSKEEFFLQEKLVKNLKQKILLSFGLHPQNPDMTLAPFLEQLISENRLNSIGESGFDLFTDYFKSHFEEQKKAFVFCAEQAAFAKLPLVIHNRKALDALFANKNLLSKIPSVIFHSFAFTPREANELLKKGINAYFSFGKAILNGNKKSIACTKELPLNRLLFETDAPFQTLKGEAFTSAQQIILVYKQAALLREIDLSELCEQAENNFKLAFLQN